MSITVIASRLAFGHEAEGVVGSHPQRIVLRNGPWIATARHAVLAAKGWASR